MDSKQSFSTSEVAKFCHVTPDTVRKWAEAGRIPVFKTPGGHRRIRRDDLIRFLQDNGMPLAGDLKPIGARVLIVEDDPAVAALIRRLLEDVGRPVDVAVAVDGFDAGHQLGVFQPDLVILDLRLPGLDGFEVCRRIKASPDTAATRVLAITGMPDPDIADRILAAGAASCLKKPFTGAEFRMALQLVGLDSRKS